MIVFSNGFRLEYVFASGALGFDGQGWVWERPLKWFGLIPKIPAVIKTLSEEPIGGNFVWYNPFRVIKFIPGGVVNAVGLTNPGVDWWCKECAPTIDWSSRELIGSVYSESAEGLCLLVEKLNRFPFKALEIDAFCPNVNEPALLETDFVVNACKKVYDVSKHPIILKLSVVHNYKEIVRRTVGIVEAISINSVPWDIVFPKKKSPLAKFGGGAVSGKAAQGDNWRMVEEIASLKKIPVIGSSIWDYGDIEKLRRRGAQAISVGAVFLPHPLRTFFLVHRSQKATT